jgi:hypothetical protein
MVPKLWPVTQDPATHSIKNKYKNTNDSIVTGITSEQIQIPEDFEIMVYDLKKK